MRIVKIPKQLRFRKRGSTIIDTLFPALYSESNKPYLGGFVV